MLELDRTEEVIREMDKLANEDHTHHATEEELNLYRCSWWIRLNFVGSDTMHIRHRPDFLLRCQPCVASRMHRIKLISKISGKALPRLGGNGKIPSGIPHVRHHRDDGIDTDGAGKPAKTVNRHFTCGMSLIMNLVQNYSDQFGNSQRSSPSPTECVKSTSPTTEKLATKTVYLQHEQQHERWGQG